MGKIIQELTKNFLRSCEKYNFTRFYSILKGLDKNLYQGMLTNIYVYMQGRKKLECTVYSKIH